MPDGRVIQVSVSRGGLPKLPVERAHVSTLGVEGDRHDEPTVHGGPMRAVCLFAMEAIQRVRAEGHPVVPGAVGENLTTQGIEWSLLPAGTRARVGDSLVLELTKPAMPCDTQRPNFASGKVNRISVKLHPADSRMYAMVIEEGEVRPGDTVELLPASEDSTAHAHLLLDRIDSVDAASNVRLWRAARAAGRNVRIIDDGELAAAASPDTPGPAFNTAVGLRTLPHFAPTVMEHFRRAGTPGWLPMETPPWPDATPDLTLEILRAEPHEVAEATVDGITLRLLDPRTDGTALRTLPLSLSPALALELSHRPDAWRAFIEVLTAASDTGQDPEPWQALAPHLLTTPHVHLVVAEDADGVPVGAGTLHVHKRVGLLRAGMVIPAARGRGIQRALIAARARLAQDLGCDLLTSSAIVDSVSLRNLLAMGFQPLWRRPVYRFDP